MANQGRLFLPLPDVGTQYRIASGYHDVRSGTTEPRRATTIEMDLPVGVNSVQPVALWPGTLGFKADQILNSFDPTSPGFTIQGDLIIKQMLAEHLNLRFYLNALLGGQVVAAPVIPPYIVVYRRTVLTSNYLYSTVLPPLRNALAVFNTQGKILNIEVDLLRAFVRGEVMINTDTSS